jgi:hypothetical protein
VEVSSGEDDVPKTNALVDKKKSASDNVEDGGVPSAEPITPNPISFDALGQSDPFTTARVAAPFFPQASMGINFLCQLLSTTGHWIR